VVGDVRRWRRETTRRLDLVADALAGRDGGGFVAATLAAARPETRRDLRAWSARGGAWRRLAHALTWLEPVDGKGLAQRVGALAARDDDVAWFLADASERPAAGPALADLLALHGERAAVVLRLASDPDVRDAVLAGGTQTVQQALARIKSRLAQATSAVWAAEVARAFLLDLLDRFGSAVNTPEPGALRSVAGRALRPLLRAALRVAGRLRAEE